MHCNALLLVHSMQNNHANSSCWKLMDSHGVHQGMWLFVELLRITSKNGVLGFPKFPMQWTNEGEEVLELGETHLHEKNIETLILERQTLKINNMIDLIMLRQTWFQRQDIVSFFLLWLVGLLVRIFQAKLIFN